MIVRIPSRIRGLVSDLELTLVTYPQHPVDINALEGDYIPMAHALDFLDRAQCKLGKGRVLIFTSAMHTRCENAYNIALKRHPVILANLWTTCVLKPFRDNFDKSASLATQVLGLDRSEIAYVDDSPIACIHALLFGFGFVVCLNEIDEFNPVMHKLERSLLESTLQPLLDQNYLDLANSLDEIIF